MPELGPVVEAFAAPKPQRVTHRGRYVTLVPLDAEVHAESLYAETHGNGRESVWDYLGDGPYASVEAMQEALHKKQHAEDAVFFAILDPATGDAIGYASYMRIEPAHRVIEVGNVLFSPRLSRTRLATEAMYLMAKHAFEDLRYRRYEWKCNSFNEPSKRAAVRFGFTYEGLFRQHMIIKGRNRDTDWFSMLDSEWPSRKAGFERWLDPANFDEQGKQKAALAMSEGGRA